MKNDGIETYIEIDGRRISLTDEDIQKINNGFEYDGKEFIEGEKARELEKNRMIVRYKDIQREIQEIKAEIQDIEDTLAEKSDQGKALAGMREKVLEARLIGAREESNEIALEGIEKFGESIIGEF